MPGLDKTGPEGKGSRTGRKLGKCTNVPENEIKEKLGRGMGLRRKAGGGKGLGKRIRNGNND
jgi:hypothetical protein